MKLTELIQLTELWFEEVGLTTKGTPIKQAEKGLEEAQEYLEACKLGDREKMVDELGDKLVTIIGDSLINKIHLGYHRIKIYYDVFVKFEYSRTKEEQIQLAELSVKSFKKYRDSVVSGESFVQPLNFYEKVNTLIKCSISADIPLDEALYFAYRKINERKSSGKIVNNTFVKAEDL